MTNHIAKVTHHSQAGNDHMDDNTNNLHHHTSFKPTLALHTLIKLHRWKAVQRMLEELHKFEKSCNCDCDLINESNPEDATKISNRIINYNFAPLLSLVCRYGAPAFVVDAILDLGHRTEEGSKSMAANTADYVTKRYALHEAMRHNAPADVIRSLCEHNPRAIHEVDCNDQTPLFYALSNPKQSKLKEETIKAVLKFEPRLLVQRNHEGLNPLEFVLTHEDCTRWSSKNVPHKVLLMLQHYTAAYKKKSRSVSRRQRSRDLRIKRQKKLEGDVEINYESLPVSICG